MNEARLIEALSLLVGPPLAQGLVVEFGKIRRDLATKTLERASPGKFVETFVQCVQQISTGKYDARPNVDHYLNVKLENAPGVPEGLRICAGRIARSIYTLRNRRNIAHKNEVDPNTFDLAYIHHGTAWIMAELIRSASGVTMQEAGSLIDLVQVPVGTLVEEIDGTRLVHADVPVRAEILILLHSHYPDRMPNSAILKSLEARSPVSVRNRLGELKGKKLIFGDVSNGYRLTQAGYSAATAEIRRLGLS